MAPIVPFIPLIAAGVGAAGTVGAAMIGASSAKKSSSMKPSGISSLSDSLDTTKPKLGVLPISTSPLGDTSTPSLTRSKLLGN